MHGFQQQRAGHHQGFLVGQQDALARLRRGQGGQQTGGADDGGHDLIDALHDGHLAEGRGARAHPGGQSCLADRVGELLGGRLVHHHGHLGTELADLLEQAVDLAVGGQGDHPIAIGMPTQHVQRAETDGTGRPQDGDTLTVHAERTSRLSPMRKIGAAAVRLSMRSRMPPWPGSN